MRQCHLCGKKIKRFREKVTKMDGLKFCISCVPLWWQERKNRALSLIYQGGRPAEIFRIPEVIIPDPDNPRAQHLMGDLVFTDKAVCFARLAALKVSAAGAVAVGVSIGGALGGAIGGLIFNVRYNRARKKAAGEAEELRNQFAPFGLEALLQGTEYILPISRHSISAIKYRRSKGLCIKAAGKRNSFRMPGGRRGYKFFKAQITNYLAR